MSRVAGHARQAARVAGRPQSRGHDAAGVGRPDDFLGLRGHELRRGVRLTAAVMFVQWGTEMRH